MTDPTPLARKLLAEMLGFNPKDNGAQRTVRIEAAGSGNLLVPRLRLAEGTTCERIKKMISEQLAGNTHHSFLLTLDHGGPVLKDADVIPPGTKTLVLVRRDPVQAAEAFVKEARLKFDVAAKVADEAKTDLQNAEAKLLDLQKRIAVENAKARGYPKSMSAPMEFRKSPKNGKNYFFFFEDYATTGDHFYWCYNTDEIVRLKANNPNSVPWTFDDSRVMAPFRTSERDYDDDYLFEK